MIALDTNILVYAHRRDSAFHVSAMQRVVALAQGRAPWAIPWPCLHEFLSIATNPRIYKTPTPLAAAADQVEAWLQSPSLAVLAESDDHWPRLKSLLLAGKVVGALVHDARIAALCLQHGVRELWTADRDFSRFPELRIVNPLVSGA